MSENQPRGVFISWSKSASLEIAKLLKPFLEDVLGTATIFMSQAMEGGSRWAMEIPQHLEICNAGLVLVTPENRHEPWLHFEAGALSKHIDGSRVVPLLCGSSVGEIQGTPLSMFQAKNFDHDDLLEICTLFGATFAIPEEAVRRRFERNWVELESEVVPITQKSGEPAGQLSLSDVMAVVERIGGQVAGIEAAFKSASAQASYAALAHRLALAREDASSTSWIFPPVTRHSNVLTAQEKHMLDALTPRERQMLSEALGRLRGAYSGSEQGDTAEQPPETDSSDSG